jgi:hypothetical protein
LVFADVKVALVGVLVVGATLNVVVGPWVVTVQLGRIVGLNETGIFVVSAAGAPVRDFVAGAELDPVIGCAVSMSVGGPATGKRDFLSVT